MKDSNIIDLNKVETECIKEIQSIKDEIFRYRRTDLLPLPETDPQLSPYIWLNQRN